MDKFTSYGSVTGSLDDRDIETIDDHSIELSFQNLSKKSQPSNQNSFFSSTLLQKTTGFLFLISFVCIGVFMTSTTKHVNITKFIGSLSKPYLISDSVPTIDFTLYRDGYKPLDSMVGKGISFMKYSILSSHKAVIEPYAEMLLYSSQIDSTSDDYYHYKLCPSGQLNTCSRGTLYPSTPEQSQSVNVECAVKDIYTIEVHKYSVSGVMIGQGTGTGICMYVRREIRSLSEDDLEKTMNAMYTLYQYKDEEGQKKYGKNFRSSNYLLQTHYFNAAWQDGDHIHEGNGFLPQHIKLTNIFETAMQSVDPSISLPYWDFTIESANGMKLWESPVFSEKMFGSLTIAKDDYWGWTYGKDSIESAAIPDGRWAKLKADKNTMFPDLNYAYGFLRAPWSMNPSPYLSRFTSNNKQVPTCSSHYDLLDYDRLADFFFMSPYAAHAPTHGTIGGVYGCDLFDPLRNAGYIIDEDAQVNLCKNWIFYLKEFFRSNYVEPKKNCKPIDSSDSISTDNQNCGFVCDESRTKDFVFALKNILNSDNTCVPTDMDNKGWLAWNEFICNGDGYKIFGGDHLESASAADPSFWPIHPTLERLLHAKFLSGGFLSTRWATDSSDEYVCDKASCYDEEKGFGFWEGCCYGHYLNDRYLDPEQGKRNTYTGLTNKEVMEGTDPTSLDYSMTYIYDKFDWSHCNNGGGSQSGSSTSINSEGYDFNAKLNALQLKAIERQSLSPEEIEAIVQSKSKIQSSTGGLKDKVNDKIGTNMYDPSIGVVDGNVPVPGEKKTEIERKGVVPESSNKSDNKNGNNNAGRSKNNVVPKL